MSIKKQIPLRISSKLYDELAAWAEDDFRSINGQIEFLLTECVRKRRKPSKSTLNATSNATSDEISNETSHDQQEE